MKNVLYSDRKNMVFILSEAVKTNKSVKYIAVKHDLGPNFLILYSFNMSMKSGEFIFSVDVDICALITFYDGSATYFFKSFVPGSIKSTYQTS